MAPTFPTDDVSLSLWLARCSVGARLSSWAGPLRESTLPQTPKYKLRSENSVQRPACYILPAPLRFESSHNLVIDHDCLVVLYRGRVVEFDIPYNLIQKEDGIFRSVHLKGGTFSELEATAKAKTESRALWLCLLQTHPSSYI